MLQNYDKSGTWTHATLLWWEWTCRAGKPKELESHALTPSGNGIWTYLRMAAIFLMISAHGWGWTDAGEGGNFPPFWNQSEDNWMHNSVLFHLAGAGLKISEVVGILLKKYEAWGRARNCQPDWFHRILQVFRYSTDYTGHFLNPSNQPPMDMPRLSRR